MSASPLRVHPTALARRAGLLVLAVLVSLAPLACAEPELEDDTLVTETESTVPPAEEELAAVPPAGMPGGEEGNVVVTLRDFEILLPEPVEAGSVTFEITNEGNTEHSFEVEGQGVEDALTAALQPGDTGTLTVDLQPGTYRVYCPIADHADARGMEATLQVVAGDDAPGVGGLEPPMGDDTPVSDAGDDAGV